jgi:4-amino-4-deoxy-L-arabinose transferase-like glycosyltransferase
MAPFVGIVFQLCVLCLDFRFGAGRPIHPKGQVPMEHMFNATAASGRARQSGAAAAGTPARATAIVRAIPLAIAVIAVGALIVRAIHGLAGDPITSDEALYLSEALSIAQGRLEYAWGDPITHRPPLYPALLAPAMALPGNSVDAARAVPVACALGALAALYWLGALTLGHRAACAGVTLAALAAAPARLSSGFFVDTPAAMFLFAAAAALVSASRSTSRALPWAAAAGALLGLSFLTKETAAAWLSLPLTWALLCGDRRLGLAPLVACYGAFSALVAPWFGWVAWHTGAAFKLDAIPAAMIGASAAAAAITLVAAVRFRLLARPRGRVLAAITVLAAWALLMLLVLESRPEPHDSSYLTNAGDWTARVFATNAEPWAAIAAAWAYGAWRASRDRSEQMVPLLLVAAGAPIYLVVADRGWEVRQVIWLVYLSYLVLGRATVDAIGAVARRWSAPQRETFTAATVLAIALVAGFASGFGPGAAADSARNWRTDDGREMAGWIDDLPDGARVLSSRLYHAQLYVDSAGRVPVRQLPTFGVTVGRDGAIEPFSTLFRYAEADLAAERHWIAFRRYAGSPYAIALAEDDLLREIREHGITHVLLTGDDAGFSSLSDGAYFDAHPAFTRVRASDASGAVLYSVDARMLAARRPPLVISGAGLSFLVRGAGAISERPAYWQRATPGGARVDGALLDEAALAGRAAALRSGQR